MEKVLTKADMQEKLANCKKEKAETKSAFILFMVIMPVPLWFAGAVVGTKESSSVLVTIALILVTLRYLSQISKLKEQMDEWNEAIEEAIGLELKEI